MENVWVLAALWVGLALLVTLLAKPSPAVEIKSWERRQDSERIRPGID